MEFYLGYKLRDIYKLSVNQIVKVGISNEYRLKVGDLRVLFTFEGDIIAINDIKPRGQVYKKL